MICPLHIFLEAPPNSLHDFFSLSMMNYLYFPGPNSVLTHLHAFPYTSDFNGNALSFLTYMVNTSSWDLNFSVISTEKLFLGSSLLLPHRAMSSRLLPSTVHFTHLLFGSYHMVGISPPLRTQQPGPYWSLSALQGSLGPLQLFPALGLRVWGWGENRL